MRTIAIGDIHGCSRAFDALLAEIQPAADDTIVTLGDYVDRGPDSRGVLETLIALDGQCRLRPLLGNHEIMMLGVLCQGLGPEIWLNCGGSATLVSYGGRLENVPAAHLEFLQRCRRSFETPTSGFIHANYVASLPLDEQPEDVGFWAHLTANIPEPHRSGKTIFVGHTPQPFGNVLNAGHLVCLDTYCFGGGFLTAMDVDTREIWQVDHHGMLRRPSLVHRAMGSRLLKSIFGRLRGG